MRLQFLFLLIVPTTALVLRDPVQMMKSNITTTYDYASDAVLIKAGAVTAEEPSNPSWKSTTGTKHYNKVSYFDSLNFTLESPKSIFFLGDSVDRYSVTDSCPGANREGDGEVSCKRGDFTLLYHLSPGSGKPPFWNQAKLGGYHLEDLESFMTKTVKPWVTQHKIEAPDLIVVSSSLWDLAQMWHNAGSEAIPIKEEVLQQWCHTDIPNYLKLVRDTFPKSTVIFRTQPLVGEHLKKSNAATLRPALSIMAECIKPQLYGNTDVIDYYSIFQESFEAGHLGTSAWRKDQFHPNPEIDIQYMNEVFNYAAALPV